ncbi:MAG: secretion protein HlyD [Solidesulfovibrio sp. DCME]|uniref:secretion protein HlyD n=1 Tax=Solidesulfovibrio sp. DCME TaxID=3447380 RepID=UPI003D0DFE19
MRRKSLWLLVGLVVCGLAWYAASRNGHRTDGLRLYGNVDIRQVDLAFRVPGKIAAVRVDEGDRVSAGDVVAELDGQPYAESLAKATAERDVALAAMNKYHAGSRSEDIAQARAQVAQLEAQVENADRLARRRHSLLRSDAVSVEESESAGYSRDALRAEREKARKALALQLAGFRAEDVAAAEASYRSAQASADLAATDLADTRLVCPSDGRVLSRVREPGAVVAAGTTVLSVSLDKPVWVRAYVPEPDLGRVHLGLPVQVFTDSRPDAPYAGTVGFISPVAEFTPKNVETEALRTDLVYRLRIVIEAPDDGLRQGMPVTVRAVPQPGPGARP